MKASDPEALFLAMREHCVCPRHLVMETGTLCHWLVRELRSYGLPVELIDARQAHAVMKLQHNKTDANDADLLAEIARTGFYRRVAVKSQASQGLNLVLKARAQLVGQRRDMENTIRGLLAGHGHRFERGSAKFVARVRAILAPHPELVPAIEPLLQVHAGIRAALDCLDTRVVTSVNADPDCRLLMTVPGVGPVTALAYQTVIDDPDRFAKSRAVGAYVGLTTRHNQSGEMDYSGRISKHGDAMVRSLLYEAANSLLTVVRRAHPLKDWARRIKKRSGYKKTCVALARKPAVILHRMLVTGEPFRWPAEANSAP